MLHQFVKLKCDNPDCLVEYSWDNPEPEKDRFDLPDGVYRFILIADPFGMGGRKWTFCGKFCLLEFMKTWVPNKSPKEQMAEVEAKRKEIEEKERQSAKDEEDLSRLVGEGGYDLSSGGSDPSNAPGISKKPR